MLAAGMMLATMPSYAQSTAVVSGDRIRADMEVLSSDSFGGRKPGTPSERMTTDFIISRFTDAGLAPAAGQGWLQPVKLVTRRLRSASLVLLGPDGTTTDLSDAVAMVGSEPSVVLNGVPVVWDEFVGKATASGAAGALILYRDGDPPGLPQPQATDGLTRLAALAAVGARGELIVVADDAFPKRKATLEAGITTLASDPTLIVRGIITESAAKRVVDAPAPVRADAKVSTGIVEFNSYNVAGVLKGARQPDEYVLFTAHWDSFGRCRPGDADEICNGAVDNASGTAGMIELARAFASGPRPDRSVLFLATTAEEMGLAGSRQYARTPLVPLGHTVAEFNLDVIVLYDRGNTAGFVGAGFTDADSVFERLATSQGRTLETGQLTRMVVRSSDAWSLLMAGVPSFILSGAIGNGAEGSKAFHDYLATRYHQPSDEFVASMPMGGAVEEVELLYAAGLYYATTGTSIRFKPESAFQRKE